MDATWHSRPRGSDTRTRAAPTWRVIYFILFIYYIYKEVISLRYREGLLTLLIFGTYIPDNIAFLFPCGTKSHALLTMQAMWRDEKRRIEGAMNRRASIACATGHRRSINARAFIQSVITVVMRSGGAHPGRPIAIQGAKSERFYNAYRAMNLGPPSTFRRTRHFRKRSIVDRLS